MVVDLTDPTAGLDAITQDFARVVREQYGVETSTRSSAGLCLCILHFPSSQDSRYVCLLAAAPLLCRLEALIWPHQASFISWFLTHSSAMSVLFHTIVLHYRNRYERTSRRQMRSPWVPRFMKQPIRAATAGKGPRGDIHHAQTSDSEHC